MEMNGEVSKVCNRGGLLFGAKEHAAPFPII